MILIAEISDKMPSVAMIWGVMTFLALPFALIAICHRRAAVAALPFAAALTTWLVVGACNEAFLDAGMADAIRSELGWNYIASSMLAPLLPTASVLAAIYVHWRRATIGSRRFEPVLKPSEYLT